MNEKEFIRICKELDEKNYGIMEQASKEYANDQDKFANFKGIADFCRTFIPRLSEITPSDVAFIYMMKHLISIMKGVSVRESLEGRHSDFQNYGKLLYGLWYEENTHEPEPETVKYAPIPDYNTLTSRSAESVVEQLMTDCKCGHKLAKHRATDFGCFAAGCECVSFEKKEDNHASYV